MKSPNVASGAHGLGLGLATVFIRSSSQDSCPAVARAATSAFLSSFVYQGMSGSGGYSGALRLMSDGRDFRGREWWWCFVAFFCTWWASVAKVTERPATKATPDRKLVVPL